MRSSCREVDPEGLRLPVDQELHQQQDKQQDTVNVLRNMEDASHLIFAGTGQVCLHHVTCLPKDQT